MLAHVTHVPPLFAAVEAIFAMLCDCAAKNPDPNQSADEEDGDFFYDEDEVLAGANGQERSDRLDHFDSLLQMPRGEEFEQVCLHELHALIHLTHVPLSDMFECVHDVTWVVHIPMSTQSRSRCGTHEVNMYQCIFS